MLNYGSKSMTMFSSRCPSWANEWNWSAKSRFHLVCLAKGQSQWLAWMVKMLLKSVLFRLLEISLIPSARYFLFLIYLTNIYVIITLSFSPLVPQLYTHMYLLCVENRVLCSDILFAQYLSGNFNDGTLYWSLASIQSSPKLA